MRGRKPKRSGRRPSREVEKRGSPASARSWRALRSFEIGSDAEPQLVELAFAVARRVLERAVARDRDAVAELAALALESVRERRSVVLRVHPEDALALREAEPGLRDRLGRERCIGLVEDPSVGRGGVVVETEAGAIDARLSVQLEALRRALAETPAVRTEGNGPPPCAAAPPAGEEPRPDGDGPAPDRPA
jgi:Flagellar assembly protein FliH